MAATAKQIVRVQAQGITRPAEAPPDNLLAVILAAAADPRCNVEKMQALLSMQKEVAAEQARISYTQDKLALTRKLPTINKDGKIEFKDKGQGKALLRFASFENINEVIRPLLDEFGFDLWFSSEPGVAGMINVIGHLDHHQGHTRTTTFPMPHDASGGKSGAQGWASAFSFGKRITTIGLLNLQTKAIEDRDRDGNAGNFKPAADGGLAEINEDRAISAGQRNEIVTAITDAKITEAQFCAHYGINQVGLLPESLFAAAIKEVAAHKQKQKDAKAHG